MLSHYAEDRTTIYLRQILIVAVTLAVSSSFFFLLTKFDNKYEAPGNQAIDGVLQISKQDWENTPLRFLCTDWAFYPNQVLVPADLTNDGNAETRLYISVGQYGNFSRGDLVRDGHGSASYALKLLLPEEKHLYSLHIPEVYSAYKFYLNNDLLVQVGNPDPQQYRDATHATTVTFWASGETNLLFSTSNYSWTFSGMVHPPAFGEPVNVSKTGALRQAITAFFCGVFAVFAFLSLMSAAASKMNRADALLIAAVCLTGIPFLIYSSLHEALELPVQPWHTIETTCTYVVLTLVVALHNRICGIGRHVASLSVGVAAAVCLLVALYSAISGNLPPVAVQVFAWFIGALIIFVAGYLLVSAVVASATTKPMTAVLIGDVVFAIALLWDRMVPSFEPILGGWFIEWGVMVLTLVTGVALARRMSASYLKNITYEKERHFMKKQLSIQAEYLRRFEERDEQERQMRHDFRQHFRTVSVLAHEGQLDELRRYAETVPQPSTQKSALRLTGNVELNALLNYYRTHALEEGVEFYTVLKLPRNLEISPIDLAIVLGNLLENAVDASRIQHAHAANKTLDTEKGRQAAPFVFVGGHIKHSQLVFVVENTYDEAIKTDSVGFFSTKHEGRGVGLASSKEVVERLGGLLTYFFDGTLFRVQVSIPLSEGPL